MEFKTSYENILVAFNHYPKGFKGKIKLEDINDTRKVFGKLFAELKGLDEANKIKEDTHNEWVNSNPQLTAEQKQEAATKVAKEYSEARKAIILDITQDQKEAILKTVKAIEWKEEERPSSGELECLGKFIEDLEATNN